MWQKIVVIILLIIIFLSPISYIITFNHNTYFSYIPTLIFYPDNKIEVDEMKPIVESRDNEITQLFHMHDRYGAKYVYDKELPEVKDLTMPSSGRAVMISLALILKLLVNRKRPFQTDPNMGHIDTPTTYNPSFPSGHAMEAYLWSAYISKKKPHLREKAEVIADKCARLRIQGGVHFPSDISASKWLVNNFLKYVI